MAAKNEPTSSKSEIEDAEVVETSTEKDQEDLSQENPEGSEEPQEGVSDELPGEVLEEAELEATDDTEQSEDLDEPREELPEAEQEEVEVSTATEAEEAQPVAAPVEKRGGMSALLGGAIAAVLGFILAQAVPNGWPVTADTEITDALADADAGLASSLAEKLDASALEPLSQQIAALSAQIDTLSAEAAAGRDALEGRIAALEDRPIVDLSSLDNSGAVEAELEALRAEIASVSAEAQRQIEEARNEATILEQNAADAAEAAARRAALSRVLAALDSGVPYEATLSEFAQISEAEIPEALVAAAAEGVPTLSNLQEEFPPLAREALAAMRAENAGGENTMGNFFRNQFGVRSLSPQDGDTPDAILSRVEGALSAGRLGDALAEIGTLPESGAAILAPWVSRAETRLAAFSAADALTQSQISN
ncbi:MAG: hypothetical protein AAFQ54_11305 [Pseudomonadota bacterium]